MRNIFANIFRTSNWWNFIFPPILGIAYFTILVNQGGLVENWFTLLMFFISFLFTASFGFFLNDMTDIEEDTKVNKQNFSVKLNPSIRYILLISTLMFSIIPWFFIKNSYPAILFFALQLSLLFLYSVKPFRLKQYTFPAIISDALYSSFVPTLIALFLFDFKIHLLPNVFICVITLFFLRGLRNIINHQIIDIENDKKSEINTFAVKNGKELTTKICVRIFWIELMGIAIFVYFLAFSLSYWAALIFPVFILYFLLKRMDVKNKTETNLFFTQILNDFYEDFLPLLFLVLLCIHDNWFFLILLIHLLLFQNKFISYFSYHFLFVLIYRKVLLWFYYKIFQNKYSKNFYRFIGLTILR